MKKEDKIYFERAYSLFGSMLVNNGKGIPMNQKENDFFDYIIKHATIGYGRFIDFKSVSDHIAKNIVKKYKDIYNK
jgi:hypothetical protein